MILAVSLVCMLTGAVLGAVLRRRLPQHHLTEESASVVRSGVGLISTMTALILGLLISSAKISYDSTANDLSELTSDVVTVDLMLAEYGPAANDTREALRGAVNEGADSVWGTAARHSPGSRTFVPSSAWARYSKNLAALPGSTDAQRSLLKNIDNLDARMAEPRLRLFTRSGTELPVPFLVIVDFWLTIIFASYTLLGKLNTTVIVFVFLFALSAAGALYLIGELGDPFAGLLQLPKSTIVDALPPLPR